MLSKSESGILESALLAAARAGHQVDEAIALLRRETRPAGDERPGRTNPLPRVYLGELKKIRAAMPGAMYVNDEGRIYVVRDGVSHTVATSRSMTRATGLLATHNAADQLIEVTELTKELQTTGWDFRNATMDRLLSALDRVEW